MMQKKLEIIDRFRGRYRFLSNFWYVDVRHSGVVYPSIEHAYQAAKTILPLERKRILECNKPGTAKRLGRQLTLRSNWESIKVNVMKELLRQKFSTIKHPSLAKRLITTGNADLVEGNTWGDEFWGRYNGKGENMLGRLLMKIRQEISD